MNQINGDRQWMRRAIHLSKRGAGKTHPNPTVGCVLVKDGEIIGEGWHHGPGKPHAEIEALRSCRKDTTGSTCYVTLEPCNHYGKTPPCTEALIDAGVKRVVIAVGDPNPHVKGNGVTTLRHSGIEVMTDFMTAEATVIIESWLKWVTTGMPFIVLKMAMSLDGHVSTYTGNSRWISCEKSREMTHKMRCSLEGIMVGAGTVKCDDPSLTARKNEKVIAAPVRIVVDLDADSPPEAKVFDVNMPGKTIWVVPGNKARDAMMSVDKSINILACSQTEDGLDLHEMMKSLGSKFSIESILLEGGPTLAFNLVKAGLVDKVKVFIAPILIGGKEAPPALAGQGFDLLSDAPRLYRRRVRKIGDDVLIEGYLGDRICLQESSEK